MTFWILSGISLLAALLATFFSDMKKVTLALWVTGLLIGGVYLSLGYELLAVIQWIIVTLVAVAFVFHGILFGEFGRPARPSGRTSWVRILFPVVLCAGFTWMVSIGSGENAIRTTTVNPPVDAPITAIGKKMVESGFLSIEILSLTLFLVVVGAGVIARAEGREK